MKARREVSLVQKKLGAEEGTRTPTPLRVHGPEPCASANSATSAWKRSYRLEFASWKSSRTAVGRAACLLSLLWELPVNPVVEMQPPAALVQISFCSLGRS